MTVPMSQRKDGSKPPAGREAPDLATPPSPEEESAERGLTVSGAGDGTGEDGFSRRPLRSDRRLALRFAAVLLVAGAVTLAAFRIDRAEGAAAWSGLQYTLLSANVLLLFALSYYLLRYLIRLVSERRAGLLGSRFKLKLVATFIGLCLVPALALYAMAIAILSHVVDRALSPEVDRIVSHAQAVSRQFYDDAQADLAGELHDLARRLETVEGSEDAVREALTAEVDRRRISAARLLHHDGRPPVAVDGAADGRDGEEPFGAGPAGLERRSLGVEAVLSGERVQWIVPSEGARHLVAGAPVRLGDGQAPSALFIARRAPADLAARVRELTDLGEQHELARARAPWVKVEQALLFLGFLLVIILGATWVALYIARTLTVPVQRLVRGTREVRRGNLGHRVEWSGKDELADLVTAFNEMSANLAGKAKAVDRTTNELVDANSALEAANDELRRRRDQMEMLLEAMTAGVLALDGGGTVRIVNRAAREILGVDARALDRPFDLVLAGEPFAELRRTVARCLGHEDVRLSKELVLSGESGPAHVQVVITGREGADGKPGLLVLLEDVTALVRAQKLATWREVARRIAHEIKNPLTPIQLSAQRILKKYRAGAEDLSDVLESGVRTIVEEVADLEQMVDEFSQFARMPEVRLAEGDVAPVLRAAADLYGGHEDLSLEVVVPDDLPAVAFDHDLLKRALVNLLDNAVEATGGRGRVRLSATSDRRRREVRLCVADDGPGIPASERERLFLPYHTTKERGTGLGLAIVDRIVADHGGRISVETNEPRGARFVIVLASAREPEARLPSPRAEAS